MEKRKFVEELKPVIRNEVQEEQIKKLLGGRTTNLPFAVNALQVVARRYLLRTHTGEVLETPEEMYERVARTLAEVEDTLSPAEREALAREFFRSMADFKFTPAGRTLANAGAGTRLVANCIVLHVEDSLDHIFQTLADAALLQQAGSGLGFPLHLMRPAGAITKTSRGNASGPVSFLHIYNTAFGVIKQDNRHGANMAVMQVDHPDILEFVHCKDREGDLRNFNVSVGLTDEFMQQVKDNDPRPWQCRFNGRTVPPRQIARDTNFNLLAVEDVSITARQMFMQIVDSAWRTGEPGCVFLDTVNAVNPVPGLGRIEACNPCGEQFLHDGDVCNLGSLNLEKFVTPDRKIDWAELQRVTKLAVRMLDNVIDISDFPVHRVNKTARNNRRIGLGIMGFADMLYQLRIGYDTKEAREVARAVMSCVQKSADEMSKQLAEEKGNFPNWDKSIFAPKDIKRRNAALTNIAPTGTIAMMFNVSGGVEPYFALAYHYRGILGGDVQLQYFNKHLEEALREAGCYSEELIAQIEKEGSLQGIDSIPEHVKRVFVTSMDISAEDHILMQAAMQEHCENAISKTINFPNAATREDILHGYITAWENKCKGCTVYRDGSRNFQVLNLGESGELSNDNAVEDDPLPVAGDAIASSSSSSSSASSATVTETLFVQTASPRKRKADAARGSNLDSGEQRDEKRRRRIYAFQASAANSKLSSCPDCSDSLVWQEGCCLCHSCGYSACSRT